MATFRPDNVSTAPTHYWKLDEENGNRSDSVVTNPLTLTDTNSVLSAAGHVNTYSALFSGSNKLDLSDSADLDFGTGDFSISFWMWLPAMQDLALIFARRDSTGSGTVEYGMTMATNPYYQVIINDGTAINVAEAFPTSQWVHIAIRRSGTSLSLFVNNTQKGSTATDSTNLSSSRPFTLGGTPYSASYAGRLEDFAFWKGYALSDSDIRNLYLGKTGGASQIIWVD